MRQVQLYTGPGRFSLFSLYPRDLYLIVEPPQLNMAVIPLNIALQGFALLAVNPSTNTVTKILRVLLYHWGSVQ